MRTKKDLNQLLKIYSEFSNFDNSGISKKELLTAANSFVEIAKGSVSKEHIIEPPIKHNYYSQNTYDFLKIHVRFWKSMSAFYLKTKFSESLRNLQFFGSKIIEIGSLSTKNHTETDPYVDVSIFEKNHALFFEFPYCNFLKIQSTLTFLFRDRIQ